MGFDRRALAAALLLLSAGAALSQDSTRWRVAGGLLALGGTAMLWRRKALTATPLPVREPAPETSALLRLQIQLEHLPAAAWLLEGSHLQALSARARRLLAPGGARDAQALQLLLAERARAGQAGQVLIETERGSERWGLALQALSLGGREQVLVLLLPLENELEAERLDAWRQLVRVLTHEIMNSLTPIASLSQSARELVDEPGAEDSLRLALDAIARRAEGLTRFVADYRRVSDWPSARLAAVDLQALFARLQAAVAPAWRARGGGASFELANPRLLLQADEAQLEQALLNLIRNAEQATEGLAEPRLWVEARLGRGGRLRLEVRDNGGGVPPGLESQIFMPFVSGREGGSGIGLAVVRQLVHGMGGRVRHVRPMEGGAAFVLSF